MTEGERFRVPQFQPDIGMEEYEGVRGVFESNWITEGPRTNEFRDRLCELLQVPYGVFAPNGTLALYLGLRAIGIGPGDEVIVPDLTFIASANAVEMTGAVPVFADVERDSFQIRIEDCRRLVGPRTRAIMPVHLFGSAADMDAVKRFADQHGLRVIEDAAQALAVTWRGQACGTFGDVGCFSFFADKTITTGEGGFVCTRLQEVYDRLRLLRNQGRMERGTFVHPAIGYNFRITDIQAAIGLVQLKKLGGILEKKRQILEWYRSHLENEEEMIFQAVDPHSTQIPFRVALVCPNAHELMAYLSAAGIQPRSFFFPLHRQPGYLKSSPSHNLPSPPENVSFPHADRAYAMGVCLPSSPSITEEQVKFVCKEIRAFCRTPDRTRAGH